jgi:hypothetical protein
MPCSGQYAYCGPFGAPEAVAWAFFNYTVMRINYAGYPSLQLPQPVSRAARLFGAAAPEITEGSLLGPHFSPDRSLAQEAVVSLPGVAREGRGRGQSSLLRVRGSPQKFTPDPKTWVPLPEVEILQARPPG